VNVRVLHAVHQVDEQVDLLLGRVAVVPLLEHVLGDQLLTVFPQQGGQQYSG